MALPAEETRAQGARAGSPRPAAAKAFYARHRRALWALGLGLPFLMVIVGLAALPSVFYDRFVWEHLWGSAVADVTQRGVAEHNGIVVGDDYTLVAELVYGALLAVSLYGIYVHVLRRFAIRVGARFVAAAVPFILYGPVARVLEDASLFCRAGTACEPNAVAFLYISPFEYLHIAGLVLLFLLLGVAIDRSAAAPRWGLLAVAGALGAAFASYGLVWSLWSREFAALAHPGVVLGSGIVALAAFEALRRRGAGAVERSLAAGGLAFLLPALWMVGRWLQGRGWAEPILGSLHVEVTPYVLGLPLLVTLAVAALGLAGRRADARLAAYLLPLNLALVYGHMLDGFASFIAICSSPQGFCSGAAVFGLTLPAYGEKHPVSNLFLGGLDGWLFPLVKLALVLAIVWVLDVEYRKDLEREPNLGGLVKMAILVLGLAPGLRDYLRLAMGT